MTGLLNSVPGFTSAHDYLTWFYDLPGDFVSGINQVLVIKESGVSILAVVLVVCFILLMLSRFTTDHN